MPTDTSELGLERLICTALAGHPCEPPAPGTVAEPPAGYGGVGWSGGNPHDYDRECCVDVVQLRAFLRATQRETADTLALNEDSPTRRRFLARLQGEVSKRGTIDVLRHGVRHGPHHLHLFYGTPSPGNEPAKERFEHTRFMESRKAAPQRQLLRLHHHPQEQDASGIKAVQTLYRLNQAHPKKHDACVTAYRNGLDEDGQVAFKGNAKGFVRTYAFLSSVLPYTNAAWEKRSIFLNFLIPKLPAPQEGDLSKGILDAIDMDSYRVEKQAMQKITLADGYGIRVVLRSDGDDVMGERNVMEPAAEWNGPFVQSHRLGQRKD